MALKTTLTKSQLTADSRRRAKDMVSRARRDITKILDGSGIHMGSPMCRQILNRLGELRSSIGEMDNRSKKRKGGA